MGFMVLPDHPAGAEIPQHTGASVLRHPSGRPWIVGDWREEEILMASSGDNTVVLLGYTGAVRESLATRLRGVRGVGDVDIVARSVAGSFHLIASIDGQVRVQGTLSTACQVFHGRVAGVTVAADCPDTVSALTGGGIDEELLALQLMAPYGPPWPLSDRTLWRGVHALPLGHYLRMDQDGTGRVVRWWTPPEPHVPLTTGSTVLRDAIVDAVVARGVRGAVSADLSGGLDSTSLCFVAARQRIPLLTVHMESSDARNPDLMWVQRYVDELSSSGHLRVSPDTLPGIYSAPTTRLNDDVEAPLAIARRPIVDHMARLIADRGATTHLQGIGSDELFLPRTMWLHGLVRRNPREAMRHVRRVRSLNRWSWLTTARIVLGGTSYPRWLADCADRLTTPHAWYGGTAGWEIAGRMPPWATADAVNAARRQLRLAAAQQPEPLSSLPVHHHMLRLTQANGTAVRRSSRISARYGVSFQAPYIDDAVVTAALSIRLPDRMAGGGVKPVLGAALRGIVPDSLIGRTSKGDASAVVYDGVDQHRQQLTDLFDGSRLVQLGLVDAAALRTVLNGLHIDARPMIPLDATLSCELWLRSVADRTELAEAPKVSAT